MKKILLTLASAFLAFSGFAQDIPEDPALGSEQNPYGEKSPWIFKIQRTQPQAETLFYYMSETTAKNGSDIVYSISLDVLNVDDSKPSYYYFTAIYVDESGKQTSYAYGSRYDLPFGGDSEKITIAAWGTKYVTFSNKPYIIGDSNWTGMAYVPSSKDGSMSEVYLNSTTNTYKSLYTINTGASTDQYLAGQAAASFANSNSLTKSCLNKATIDYASGSISFEPVQSVVLDIQNARTFVAPIDINVPTGVKVFTYAACENGVLSVEQLDVEIIPANTPVILKANVSGSYEFSFAGSEFQYKEETSPRTFLSDIQYESYPFYGVHGVHYVPAGGYTFDGEKFVKANSSDIITALNCYVMSDDDVESIEIVFPEEEEPEEEPEEPAEVLYIHFTDEKGNHLQTHFTELPYANGVYSNTVDVGPYEYFVFSDATFEKSVVSTYATYPDPDDYPQNKQWNELSEDAIIYHLAENAEVLSDDEDEDVQPAEPVTNNIVATKVSALNGKNPTPIQVESGLIHTITLDPDPQNATLKVTSTGETTGIENVIVNEPSIQDNRIFNIYGQQVDETYKGIIIKNGKKVYNR